MLNIEHNDSALIIYTYRFNWLIKTKKAMKYYCNVSMNVRY